MPPLVLERSDRFWKEQANRLAVRWVIVRYGLLSAVIWLVAVVAGAWLRHWGLEWIFWVGLGTWMWLASPTLYVHAQVILDVVSYALTQRVYFFPLLMAEANNETAEERMAVLTPRARRWVRRLVKVHYVAGYASPIFAPAMWCLVVLVRLPEKVRQPQASIRAEMKATVAVGRKIINTVSEGFAERQVGLVA